LRIRRALPGVQVEEMVIKALIARGVCLGTVRTAPEKRQRGQYTCTPRLAVDPAAVDPHGERRQPEPDSGNARERRLAAAVFDQAVCQVGLVPEIVECRVLHEIEEGLVMQDTGCRTQRGGVVAF